MSEPIPHVITVYFLHITNKENEEQIITLHSLCSLEFIELTRTMPFEEWAEKFDSIWHIAEEHDTIHPFTLSEWRWATGEEVLRYGDSRHDDDYF